MKASCEPAAESFWYNCSTSVTPCGQSVRRTVLSPWGRRRAGDSVAIVVNVRYRSYSLGASGQEREQCLGRHAVPTTLKPRSHQNCSDLLQNQENLTLLPFSCNL